MPSRNRSRHSDRPPCLSARDRPTRRKRGQGQHYPQTFQALPRTERTVGNKVTVARGNRPVSSEPKAEAAAAPMEEDELDRDHDDDREDDGAAAENPMDATRLDGDDDDRLDIHSVLSGDAAEDGDGVEDDDDEWGGAHPDRRGDEAGSRRRAGLPPPVRHRRPEPRDAVGVEQVRIGPAVDQHRHGHAHDRRQRLRGQGAPQLPRGAVPGLMDAGPLRHQQDQHVGHQGLFEEDDHALQGVRYVHVELLQHAPGYENMRQRTCWSRRTMPCRPRSTTSGRPSRLSSAP
mmetsp:Transcript_32669/g.69610  ORF Transcript_32669/g.69610 Transcript_32669/m.69610 type:complete len:289 (+) Transcript_32669:323-1189(+)